MWRGDRRPTHSPVQDNGGVGVNLCQVGATEQTETDVNEGEGGGDVCRILTCSQSKSIDEIRFMHIILYI